MNYSEINYINEALEANSRNDAQLGLLEVEISGETVAVATHVKKRHGEPCSASELPFVVDELLLMLKNFKNVYGNGAVEYELHQAPYIVDAIKEAKRMEELKKILAA